MIDWLPWIQETFKNRQIAAGIWLLIAIGFCLVPKGLRSSMWGLLKTSMHKKLIVLFGSLGMYLTILCRLFLSLGLWATNQLASTFLWFLFSGIALSGRAILIKDDENYFRKLVRDSVKVLVVFEFLIAEYSFSLAWELVLLPVTALLGLLIVFSEDKTEYASVTKFLQLILLAVVALCLWNSITSLWEQPAAFLTTKTGRDFLLPILLTLGSIPFLYLLHCYSHLERAAIQINQKVFQSDDLKRYAKRRFYLIFLFRPRLLRRAVKQFHSLPAETNGDVDQIITDIRAYERHHKSPPKVDEKLGWSPYLARDFLQSEGLQTEEYHPGYRNRDWWGKSEDVDLDDQIFPNRATFSIEGRRHLVTALKLNAYFDGESDPSVAEIRFNEIALTLLERSNSGNAQHVQEAIRSDRCFALTVGKTRVIRKVEPYPLGKAFELYFILTRDDA